VKVSVCMIVKNEEKHLDRALSSVPPHYEIVVVDTGSNDRTMQIASSYNCKLVHHPWNNSFAEARNISISYATGDLIVVLDADEELRANTDTLIQTMPNLLNQASTVIIRNHNKDEITQHRNIRIFPNDPSYRYVGDVHERLFYKDREADAIDSLIKIEHYGYNEDNYIETGKYERYLDIYKKCLSEEPANGYMWYQLGKLHYSNKKYEAAYEAFAEGAVLEQFEYLYYPVMMVQLGYTLKELGKSQEALELLEPLLDLYPEYPDLPFLLGILSMFAGNMERVRYFFQTAFDIGETDKYTTVLGVGSFKAAYNLGVYYEVTRNYDFAKHYYKLSAEADFNPAKTRLNIVLKEH